MLEVWGVGMLFFGMLTACAFLMILGFTLDAWNRPRERRTNCRILLMIVGVACLIPFWPVIVPALLVIGALKVWNAADLSGAHE